VTRPDARGEKDIPRMTRATAILSPGVPVTLAPAGNISFEIEAGQRVRLTQPEGEQVADFISFNRDDVRELLSMHSSRAVNLNWKLTAPHVLYSNRTRAMWQIASTNKRLLRLAQAVPPPWMRSVT